MLTEEESLFPIVIRREALELAAQQALLEQLFLKPDRQRDAERAQALRCESKISFEQPFEFKEGLVVKDNVVNLAEVDPRLVEAVLYRMAWEPGVVFSAGEALFLCRRDDAAVGNQGRCAI